MTLLCTTDHFESTTLTSVKTPWWWHTCGAGTCRRRFCAYCMYIPPYFLFYQWSGGNQKYIAFDSAPEVELSRAPINVGRSETKIAVSNLAWGTVVSPQFCSVRVDISVFPSKSLTVLHVKLTTHLRLVSRCRTHGTLHPCCLCTFVSVLRHLPLYRA